MIDLNKAHARRNTERQSRFILQGLGHEVGEYNARNRSTRFALTQ